MGTCLVQSVSQDHQETRAASPQEARWSSNVPDSGDRRWMSLPPSSEVQKIGKTFKCFASFFCKTLDFFCKCKCFQSVNNLSQMGRTGSISDAMASLEGRGSGSLPRWRTTVGGHR